MKRILVIMMIVGLLAGCGGKGYKKITEDAKLEWKIEEYNWARSGTIQSLCLDNNQLFIPLVDKDTYVLNHYAFDGTLKKSLPLKSGKGPGEVMQPWAVTFDEEHYYVFDGRMERITIFDLEGNYVDDYVMHEFPGWIHSLQVHKDKIYFYGAYREHMITRYDMKFNEERNLANEKTLKTLEKGDKGDMGQIVINHDTEEICFVNHGLPFEIKKYDLDLNQTGVMTTDLTYSYKDYTFTGRSFTGDLIVGNMQPYKKYIYVCAGSRDLGPNKPIFINIFDTETDELKYHIICPNLEKCSEMASFYIIGVAEQKIWLLVSEYNRETGIMDMDIMSVSNPVK